MDAATFLQGQFSNDIRPAQLGTVVYGLWLNMKGKVQGDSFVLRGGTDEWLAASLYTSGSELQRRFDAYIVADDVSVESVEEQTLAVIFSEQPLEKNLEMGLLDRPSGLPDGEFQVVADGRMFRGIASDWLWAGPNAAVPVMAERLRANGGVEVGEEAYLCWRIGKGMPAVPDEFGPADLPQEGGFDRHAVSFSKGCYLGQEVMARLHAIGQVRRSLAVVRGKGSAPSPGTELFASGKRVGEIRSAISTGEAAEQFVGLAMVLRAAVAEKVTIGLLGATGSRPLTIELVSS